MEKRSQYPSFRRPNAPFQFDGAPRIDRKSDWGKSLIRMACEGLMTNRRDPLAERAALAARIAECAEGGMVAMLYSGMDCDCVRFSGASSPIPATVVAVEAYLNSGYENAEGPWNASITRPSAAAGVAYQSRDLIAEAYEDGHPHVVYS